MSFQDFGRDVEGGGAARVAATGSQAADHEYVRLSQNIQEQLGAYQRHIAGIQRCCTQLGTKTDTMKLRENMCVAAPLATAAAVARGARGSLAVPSAAQAHTHSLRGNHGGHLGARRQAAAGPRAGRGPVATRAGARARA